MKTADHWAFSKALVILSFFLFNAALLRSQPVFDWVTTVGGGANETAYIVEVGPFGSSVVSGTFSNTVDFDTTSGTLNLTATGNNDYFLVKNNPQGTLLWAKTFGGRTEVTDVTIDSIGGIYIIGRFESTVDFDPGSGTQNLTSFGSGRDLFVVKLDSNGAYEWAFSFETNGTDGRGGLLIDNENRLVVTAGFANTIDLDPGPGTMIAAASSWSSDGFIARFNMANSNFIDATTFGATGARYEYPEIIETDSAGNYYLFGTYVGTNTNLGLSGGASYTSSNQDMFLAKFDKNFNYKWVGAFGGSGGSNQDVPRDMVVDDDGHVFMVGSFAGTVDFNPGSGTANFTAGGFMDGYVMQWDTLGNYQWAYQLGNIYSDEVTGIELDTAGNIMICGNFRNVVDFSIGGGTGIHDAFGTQGFVAAYTPAGSYLWSWLIGFLGTTQFYDLASTSNYELYLAGNTNGTVVDFDPGTGVGNAYTPSSLNYYYALARYRPCQQPGLPNLSITQDSICAGENTYMITSGDLNDAQLWAIYSGGCGSQPEGGSNSVLQPLNGYTSTTTFYVRGEGGCVVADSCSQITLNVNPLPSISVNADPGWNVCDGDSMTLTASGGVTHQWTGGVQNGVTFLPVNSGFTSLTVTDSNGCSDDQLYYVSVVSNPTVTASVSPSANLCEGDNVTLNGSGALNYTWSGGVTNNSPFAPTTSGTYSVTGTDNNGCTGTASISLTVNPLPTVTGMASNSELCLGDPTTLTGAGASSYSWSGGAINGNAFSPTATTTYIVTGTDANNCEDTAQVTVIVNPLPAVVAQVSDAAVCEGDSTTLQASGANSYTWSNGLPNGTTYVPTSTQTLSVTGVDNNGCSNSASIQVVVNANPIVVAGASDTSICIGDSATLMGSGANNYTWSGGVQDGVAFTPIGTQTYTVLGVDANQCEGTDDITIQVNPLPDVVANATPAVVCDGDSLVLFGTGAELYVWTNGVQDSVGFIPLATASFLVTGTDGNGCINVDSISVEVVDFPVVDLGNDTILCQNESFVITPGNYASYTWNDMSTGSSLTIDSTMGGTGTQSIWVEVLDENGCPGSDSMLVSFDVCVGIVDKAAEHAIQLFPNPTSGSVQLITEDMLFTQVELYDLSGKRVLAQNVNSLTTVIELSNLASGSYILRASGAEEAFVRMIVKH